MARRRRAIALVAAAIVLIGVIAAGGAWMARRSSSSTHAADVPTDPMDPAEARLRQRAAQAPGEGKFSRELGDTLMRQGRFFSAAWSYQEALRRTPSDLDARLGLARALANVQQFDVAAAKLEEVLKPGSGLTPSERGEAARALTVIYLRTARPRLAIALLKPLRAAAPVLEIDLARAYRAAGDLASAEAAFRRVSAADPSDEDAALGLAQVYLDERQPNAAVQVLTDPGKRGATSGEVWLWLGKAYAEQSGRLDTAATCVARAMDRMPRSALPYLEAGYLFSRKGDHVAAADQFAQAARLEPLLAEAQRGLGQELRALGLSRRASQAMARYYELRGQPDQVIAALSTDGGVPTAEADSARQAILAYTAMQRAADAVRLSEAALRRHPEDPGLIQQAMLIHLTAGSRKKLEALCRDVERKFPESSDPDWFRGRIAMADTRTADAIRYFESALARGKERPGLYGALAEAYVTVPTPENLRRALPLVRKAVALQPNDASTRRQLGELLARLGQPQAAEEQLLRALDLNPSLAGAMNALLQVCSTLKRPAHAALLGELIRSLETRERILRQLRRPLYERPQDPAARIALARALARAGRPGEARSHWERAAMTSPDPGAGRELAAAERLLEILRG